MSPFGAKKWTATVAVLFAAIAGAASQDTIPDDAILEVPFIPQSEALCGGAAAAMVLRYWGERGIDDDSFALLVETSAGGIRTGRLVADLERRGYHAFPFEGDEALIRQHLAAGRPVIALVEDRPRRHHYVVLVGWRNDSVLLHDPARAPFRVFSARSFDAAWEATGRWSLLVLPDTARTHRGPPPTGTADSRTPVTSSAVPRGTLASLVAEGVRLGREGDLDAAEVRLRAATALWPDSAAAWGELAGIRFRQREWSEAADLAHRAAHLDPENAHAWRILGASRFLEDDPEDALGAWNQVGEPRLDLTRIDGLRRTRFTIVSDRLGLDSGSLLTPRSFARARKRLSDIPVFESSRLDCRPLPGGIAEVEAAVLERPLFWSGSLGAATLAVRALVGDELVVSLASPTGSGELWTAMWRWEENRTRVRMVVGAPSVGGLPGILSVEAFREQQSYDADLVTPHTAAPSGIPQGTICEERRHVGVSWREWLLADLSCRAEIGLEDGESEGGHSLGSGLALDLRPFSETVSLQVEAARWLGLAGGRTFAAGSACASWRPAVPRIRDAALEARVGYRVAGESAPLALWPGAGTGQGRADLLRAHPLLDGGIVRGEAFGRALWSAGLELDYSPWRLGPVRAGVAWFVDAARPRNLPAGRPDVPARVDAGAGFRLAGLGPDGEISLNAAHGLVDGESSLSLVWQEALTR